MLRFRRAPRQDLTRSDPSLDRKGRATKPHTKRPIPGNMGQNVSRNDPSPGQTLTKCRFGWRWLVARFISLKMLYFKYRSHFVSSSGEAMPQCANSCGRFAAEGFSTCCRSCGTGTHGAICEAAQQVLNQPDPKPRCACGRFASVGYSTCCKLCGTGKHGRTCDTVEIARKAWVAAAGPVETLVERFDTEPFSDS